MQKYTFEALREKHPEFIYHSYEITTNGIKYHFSIDDFHFYPTWELPENSLSDISEPIEYAIFNLGMAELVSYWKCACPPTVRVNCGRLTEEQCLWWKKLYYHGLGEFFYRNGISTDFESFMTIIPADKGYKKIKSDKPHDGFLVPVGGGKDSVVTLELLSGYHDKTACYIINPRGATVDCAVTAGFVEGDILTARRTIDRELLARNADGYLNGHTPFSAVVAFSAYLYACLFGKKYIALSNECSANDAYVKGTDINHQYSKSVEFERDFREYTAKYLDGDIEYFSLLRPWTEWQIARKFVQYPKYFGVFQSCNLGSKTNVWCAACAKCLYVYILLAAFLDDDTLINIFGKNMLEERDMQSIFDGLIYDDIDKPFECVGTKEEIRLALYTAAEKREKLPYLLAGYMSTNPEKPASLDDFFDYNNFVPKELLNILK